MVMAMYTKELRETKKKEKYKDKWKNCETREHLKSIIASTFDGFV